jgi:phosphate starvation-inducible PhoH-like protein
VRHALVQRIVRAYESMKPQQQELPLGIGDGIEVRTQTRDARTAPTSLHPAKPQ